MSTKDSKNSNKSAVEEVDEIATLPTAIDDHEDGEIVKRITVREPIVQVQTPDAGPSTSTANQNPDPKLMAVLKSLVSEAMAEKENAAGQNSELHNSQNKGHYNKSRTNRESALAHISDAEYELKQRSRKRVHKTSEPEADRTDRSRRPNVHEISDAEHEPMSKKRRSASQQTDSEGEITDFLDSEPEEHPEDEWWEDLQQGLETDDVEGPEVPGKLADIVTKALRNKLSDEKVKELFETYPRTSNLPALISPRIHEGMWKNLEQEVRTFDVHLTRIGEKSIKAITGAVKQVERITKLKDSITDSNLRKELKDIARSQIEIIKLSALAVCDLNQARRNKLRPHLHKDYKSLCNPPEQEGEWLLGDGLPEKIKDMNEISKLGQQLLDKKNGPKGKWGDKAFLGKSKTLYQSKCYPNDAEKSWGDSRIIMHPVYVCRRQEQTRAAESELAEPLQWAELLQGAEPLQRAKPIQRAQSVQRAEPIQRADSPTQQWPRQQLSNSVQEKEVNMVSFTDEWYKFKENTIKRGKEQAENFNAGRTKYHAKFWKSLTTDPSIIAMVTGTTLELENVIWQVEKPIPFKFDKVKEQKIDHEISRLLNKGVICRAEPISDQYLSNIFTRDKPDASIRLILDLADFNENIVYRHFKMDSLNTAIDLMSQNCYMASIDWKDAYYSVPIAKSFQKYLRFEWRGKLYQYTCYPNGLSSAPRNLH